jgi:hypothetical protein
MNHLLPKLKIRPKNIQSPGYRWFVVIVFFAFMLLHQSDKLVIGPLTKKIMSTFEIT